MEEDEKENSEISEEEIKNKVSEKDFESFIQTPEIESKSPVLDQVEESENVTNLEQFVVDAPAPSLNKKSENDPFKYSASAEDNEAKYTSSEQVKTQGFHTQSSLKVRRSLMETMPSAQTQFQPLHDFENQSQEKYISPEKVQERDIGKNPFEPKTSKIKYILSKS